MIARGFALAIAVVAALLVSITAAVVLGLTYRSLYLSVFQTDHTVAFYSAEAGVQYTFARLNLNNPATDTFLLVKTDNTTVAPAQTLQQHVINKGANTPFIIISNGTFTGLYGGAAANHYDHYDPNLANGPQGGAKTKYVTVSITTPNPAANPPQFTISSQTDYGNLPQ